MKVPHNAHIAVVDGNRFLLMRNTGQMFEPKLGHVENPDLDPTNYSAGIRAQDEASQRSGSTDLNELAHAAAVAEWLNAKAKVGEINDLIIVADPKSLGEMRHHYHPELKSRLCGELAKTMTGEPTDKIAAALADA